VTRRRTDIVGIWGAASFGLLQNPRIGTLYMITKLERILKREINVSGKPYIVTIAPDGLKLTVKGRRKGQELEWAALVSGDAAMAVALNASLQQA
jgi:hypothetical protein